MIAKIISGGQTGVDRAALGVALELGIPCGGWCPRGRQAEDGPIAPHYPLKETESTFYEHRTELNVRDSDATLVLTRGVPDGGTALTIHLARELKKPCLLIDLGERPDPREVYEWLDRNRVQVLNIAGPRESKHPGIYAQAKAFLREILAGCCE
jgi:hypothetical protein